ncbi:excinuclease ABC subunit UvrA [Prevotella sp. OH937_COT-195]|uniref:excinuclease ABC subunit UvrA n=1 Tax=Prevotella sp. OH937_COT-195 TaxID=2491051 RepID=UPI000F64D0BE|nr:excinuclease ABC subunit UvrA [Prevotella sp. OH937_COT-195]RRD02178.1 excinuclease ABC subunit A [Prevotella sp. OH937_COT-195]
MHNYIEIRNARVNNLKNISLNIPRDKFIVISGVSGSGKSSLAFNTLYAEGQRRYVESLSSYARQFLGRMSKPECDYIKGLPPAIAIEQKVISRNPRSTVGTSTEIYEYLRLLFARIGRTYSPLSGKEVRKHTIEDIITCTKQYGNGTRFVILSPINLPEGRSLEKQLKMYLQEGFVRLWVDNDFVRIDDFMENKENLDKDTNELMLLIDRLSVDTSGDVISRIIDSSETAFYEGNGECRLMFLPSNISYDFSKRFEADGMVFEEPNDNMFSFNSSLGACPTCEGFGKIMGIDEKLVIQNSSLSVFDGCVQCWHGDKMKMWQEEFCRRAANDNFPIFEPYYSLSRKHKDMLWHGLPGDKERDEHDRISIDAFFKMLAENKYKIQNRIMISRYSGKTTCPTCHGTRMKKEVNYVKINGMSITDLVEMPIINLYEWFKNIELNEQEKKISKRLITEICSRLEFIVNVGLGYLTLNRQSNTLSGGESQRINLTTSLGSSLVGSLYILDEPSIGLHSRDTYRLIKVLKELKTIGNTVIVVEHDEEIIRSADYLVDIGSDAGRFGGEIVFEGDTNDICRLTDKDSYESEKEVRSHTVCYLTGQKKITLPTSRRQWNMSILLKGARMNNLKSIDAQFPLNVMTVVTGVSGSGKSSLVKGILYPALKRRINEVAELPGEYVSLEGDWEEIKHVEMIDQNPIGKSTRSNAATYVKAYDAIRQLFADLPLSKQMGFTPQYFSFNTEGGRCEECKGAGIITVEMQFMADISLQCDSCNGKRFKKDILDVHFNGKNINDILEMTVSEAIEFFNKYNQKTIVNRLIPLEAVGLGYIKLGQNSSTLSGGENQRVKLALYIGQERQEPTLFVFDEPTTGLHFNDIKKLLSAFDALIERGHTIIVIEHNMDVIKCADHIIDLGPEGGADGGFIVCCGTPEEISLCKKSITGEYLKAKL